MSICSNSVRAWSRSRVKSYKTLLPFLYQTATIQQCRPSTPALARRNLAYRSDGSDHIPFDDASLPKPVDAPDSSHKTTITGSERAAFEKLYRKFNTRGRPKNEKDHVVELDQIADEYYEDDEEPSSQNLDQVFDEALKGQAHLRPSRSSHGVSASFAKEPESSKPLEDAATSHMTTAQRRRREAQAKRKAEAALLKAKRLAERARVDSLLNKSQTDRELWQILEREVFDKVKALDLDGTVYTDRSSIAYSMGLPKNMDPRVIFQNYPHHLIAAVSILRNHFPASPLSFNIIPTIKSLGRSSYALGATTSLYIALIRQAWIQKASYAQIDALLVEMNNNAIEFNEEILTLLDTIIKEHEYAKRRSYGSKMALVHSMDLFTEGIEKLKQWRSFIADKVNPPDTDRLQNAHRQNYMHKGVQRVAVTPERSVTNDALSSAEADGPREEFVGSGDVSSHHARARVTTWGSEPQQPKAMPDDEELEVFLQDADGSVVKGERADIKFPVAPSDDELDALLKEAEEAEKKE